MATASGSSKKNRVAFIILVSVYVLLGTAAITVFEAGYAFQGPHEAEHTFVISVEAEGDYHLHLDHFLRGPWEGFSEIPERLASYEGDILVRDGPGGIYIDGTGDGTVTLRLAFYGGIGMQEWSPTGAITVSPEGNATSITIAFDGHSQWCRSQAHWTGLLDGQTTLPIRDQNSACA